MKKHLLLALVFAASTLYTFADHLSERLMFTARLDGENNTTVTNPDANGIATLFLNANRDTMFVNVACGNLGGSISGAHIHSGQPGENGPVVMDLSPFVNQNIIRTTITGELLDSLLPMMFMESLYLNVHTENPIGTGTARGQIKLERDFGFYTNLDTAQEIPEPQNSEAFGSGNFIIDQNDDSMRVAVITSGLTGDATGAHLHFAPAGQNGPVIVDLTSLIRDGSRITGKIAVPDSLKGGKLKSYVASGLIYLNVHTMENMPGEIRGQGLVSSDLYLDALINPEGLDNGQIVQTDVEAAGHGYINASFDSFRYFFVYEEENLSGAPVTVGFYQDGVLVKSLTANAGTISGSWDADDATQPLTEELMRSLLYGEISLRISTTLNAAGELEGTLIRALREGYAYELDTEQEVPTPTVSKTPLGGGMVSIDSRRSNAHIMLAFDSLSGPATGGHIHLGVPGETGDVLFPLPLNNNAAFTYWTATDGFTPANELQFRRDSLYVNIHTMQNAPGEIRGNITRNYRISSETSDLVDLNGFKIDYSVYPNPVRDNLNITLSEKLGRDMEIRLTDISGKSLFNTSLKAGNQQSKINMSDLNQGSYILSFLMDGELVASERLVK
ncbi:MAG: CHRD domain-containing protein [Luteibaculum sp.]